MKRLAMAGHTPDYIQKYLFQVNQIIRLVSAYNALILKFMSF